LDICGSSIDEFVDGLLNFDRVSFRDQENPADSIIGFVGQFVNNLTFTHGLLGPPTKFRTLSPKNADERVRWTTVR